MPIKASSSLRLTTSNDHERSHSALRYFPSAWRGRDSLLGRTLHATEEEKIDVAVVKMNQETKARLDDAGARFLRVTDVDNRATATPGLYLVRGYPIDCNADPMTYSDGLVPRRRSNRFRISVRPRLSSAARSQSGLAVAWRATSSRSPKLTGMSGCGIWRLTTRPPNDLAAWSPDERRLVAIQTKCKYGSFLKGTWIRHAFGLIHHRCPELRSVMSTLYIPRQ